MKTYQKAELIAKDLPTGSYAAGCPSQYSQNGSNGGPWGSTGDQHNCRGCEVAM